MQITTTDALQSEAADRPRTFLMPLFKPGVTVMRNGRAEKVSHISIRRREMVVFLEGREDPVKPDQLTLAPLMFTTERRPEVLRWYL